MNIPDAREHMRTVGALDTIARLAGQIVLETPVRSRFSTTSYVRRSLIWELERALTAAGYDMTAARKRMKEAEKAKESAA